MKAENLYFLEFLSIQRIKLIKVEWNDDIVLYMGIQPRKRKAKKNFYYCYVLFVKETKHMIGKETTHKEHKTNEKEAFRATINAKKYSFACWLNSPLLASFGAAHYY